MSGETMPEPKAKFQFDSYIKLMVLHEVRKNVNQVLGEMLANCMLMNQLSPTAETQEQLNAVEVACREILEQVSQIDVTTSFKTDLRTLPTNDVHYLLSMLKAKDRASP